MNSIRSTERSISMLCHGASRAILKPRSAILKNQDIFVKKTNKRSHYSAANATKPFRPIRFQRESVNRIVTRDLKQVSKKTVPLEVKPLLNPNKSDIKGAIIKPIVPLTHPRFVRTGNVEAPSVTKILQATMPAKSKFILDKWKEGMIKKLGMAGFMKYQKDTFARGSALHALLAKYLLGQGGPAGDGAEINHDIVKNLWKSIEHIVRDKITNVRLVEHTVTFADMNYRGIVDCVGFYEDELVVIDFKTSEKPKKNVESLYDNPLQVAAYCGAINNDLSIPAHVIDRNICSGVVIVAYCDGSKASTYYLSSDEVANNYWKQWIQRLDQYSRMSELPTAD